MKRLLPNAATSLLLAALPACAMSPPPIIGGPCAYDSMEVTGTVQAVYEDAALLKEDGTEIVFDIALSQFRDPPEAGQRFNLAKRHIVKGTCTPYSYMLGARLDAAEEEAPVSSQ